MAFVKIFRFNIPVVWKKRVVVANHVVGKRDHPLLCEVDATRRDAPGVRVRHAPIFPMAVWI